jgi:hypothetical protein
MAFSVSPSLHRKIHQNREPILNQHHLSTITTKPSPCPPLCTTWHKSAKPQPNPKLSTGLRKRKEKIVEGLERKKSRCEGEEHHNTASSHRPVLC